MSSPLRVLVVEDSPDDAELILLELARGGFDPAWRRTESEAELRSALAETSWDVVLSDFTLPGFGADAALAICRQADPDLPFLVISGTVGEEQAVAMMRAGASDYLLKHNLARLVPAVNREIREAENRRARREAERQAQQLAAIISDADHAIISQTLDGVVTTWNTGAERLYGYTAEEAIGQDASFLMPPDRTDDLVMARERIGRGESVPAFDTVRLHKSGARLEVSVGLSPVRDSQGRVIGVSGIGKDVSQGKRAERDRQVLLSIVEYSPDFVGIARLDQRVVFVNRAGQALVGLDGDDEVRRTSILDYFDPKEQMRVAAEVLPILEAGGHVTGEATFRHFRTGSATPIEWNVFAVPDPDGDGPAFLACVAHDVSERKQTDEALRRSEERYRGLIESIPVLMWMYDGKGRPQFHNRRWYEYTGQTPEQTLADRWYESLHPDDVEGAVSMWSRCKATGDPYAFEYRLRRTDGVYRWFLSQGTAVWGPGGIEQWVGVCTDIDDRKHADQNLRQTSDLLRAVADGTPDAVFVKDRSGRYLLFNPAAARFVGKPVEEVLGKDDTALFDPVDARLVMAGDRQVMDSERTLTREEELTAAGVTRTYLATKAPYRDAAGNLIGVLGISRDVTERKRAEEALRDKEAKLAEAVRLARMGYWSRDLISGVLHWSDELYELFGVDPATFGHTLESFLATLHPDDREAVRERIEQGVLAIESFDHTYRIIVRGEIRVIHEVGQVYAGEDGRPCRVSGTAQDVTDRTRAEEALRLRDRAIGAATQGIVIADPNRPDNPIIYASPGFERLTGYSQAEALGRNCRFLQGRDTDPDTIERLREAIREAHTCTVELINYRKDGTSFWNELSIAPVRDDQGRLTHFVGVQTDVTQRRLLETQYHQAQKMEAVGQLAGGVAHDFNNLLTVISGYSELLLHRMTPDDPHRDLVVEIHRAGERSAALTRQLLAFSRKQVVQPQVLDLDAVLAGAEKLLGRVIGEDIRLQTALNTPTSRVKADPGQLEQVLLNLAVNARDAMPQGGRLTIETRAVELDDDYALTHPGVRPGPYLRLAVTDTGSGMSPEVKARIFEPFFTTKEVGKGSGLGLAVVHGIVQQAGGHVEVHSEPGVGTTFGVYLPRVDQQAAPVRTAHEIRPAPRGTETVLLVEDEDGVRALTRHVLQGCGYSVLEAADGEEGLEVAGRWGSTIHLLVTDVVMPGLGGRELAERIRSLHPEVKVLYVSGYTDDAVVRHGVLEEQVHFLQKPFSPLTLAFKVREILDGSPF